MNASWFIGQIDLWGGLGLCCVCLVALLCCLPVAGPGTLITLLVFALIGGGMMLAAPLLMDGWWLWGVLNSDQEFVNALGEATGFVRNFHPPQKTARREDLQKSVRDYVGSAEEEKFKKAIEALQKATGTFLKANNLLILEEDETEKLDHFDPQRETPELHFFMELANMITDNDIFAMAAEQALLLLVTARKVLPLLQDCGQHHAKVTHVNRTTAAVDRVLKLMGVNTAELVAR
ncbi:MAG: hypothetical protein LBB14_02350 [Puniceicoccales bacterium]|jgi:hypothetical protein|nr:hypothetical protein [Puniceicoccales bacterium]